jgi:diazepam-binding inhibitor (GABA receptor modulator, acyl-CoA-binding protein)
MSAPQSEAFKTAVVDSGKLTSKPTDEQLLDLYGACSSNKGIVYITSFATRH